MTSTERAIYRGLALSAGIVALGAVLFPVFFQTNHGHVPVGLRNVKRLATGFSIYLADSDETLPFGTAATGPTAVGWGERIYPYVKDDSAYRDPLEEGGIISYAMNANALASPKVSAPASPNRTVLLFEVSHARPGRGAEFHSALRLSPVGDGAAGGFLDSTDLEIEPMVRSATGPLLNSGLDSRSESRHKGRSSFAFLDSHAKYFPPNEVSAGANARRPQIIATPSGCFRPDLPGRNRPCAESVAGTVKATFSFW